MLTQGRSDKSKLRAGCINKEPGGHSLIIAQLIRQKLFVMEEPRGVSGKGRRNNRKVWEAQCLAARILFRRGCFTVSPAAPRTLFLLPGTMLPTLPPPFLDSSKATASPAFLQDSIPHPLPLSQHSQHCYLILTPSQAVSSEAKDHAHFVHCCLPSA